MRRLVRLLSLAAAWCVAACGSAPAPTSAMASPHEIQWAPMQRVTIGDQELEQSLVHIQVADTEGLVFVDTGAASSFFSDAFVEHTGLPVQLREITVTDGHGATGQRVAVLNNVGVRVAPLGSVVIPSAVGLPLPLPMMNAGIAGGINPQSLADESMAVVLDLGGNRMTRVPIASARTLLTGRRLDDDTTQACRYEESGIDGFIYTTEIEIGGQRALFSIDTGAGTSRFVYDHPAGRSLYEQASEEVSSRGIVGQSVDRLARDVPIRVAGHEFNLEGLAVSLSEAEEQPCPFVGVLGMDVLGGCLLVLEVDRLSISCPQVPQPS